MFLIAKNSKNSIVKRRNGIILIAAAPILFILSGLFLANTVINPVESLPYIVGEVLCFAVAPALLLLGIAIFFMAPHEKKSVQPEQLPSEHPKKKPSYYSRPRLLFQRALDLVFLIFLLAVPLYMVGLTEGTIAFFVLFLFGFPFCYFTLPLLVAAIYLLFNKKKRISDIPVFILCAFSIVNLLIPGLPILTIFFLPFILFSTPFGLIAIALVLVIILIIILIGRRKRRSP